MAAGGVLQALANGSLLSSDAAAQALKYQSLNNDIDILAQREEIRKLKFDAHLLAAQIDDYDMERYQANEKVADLEYEVEAAREELDSRLEQTEGELQSLTNKFRAKDRELTTLRTELASLQTISADSTKLLTEKLALARELDTLKPELEDLRSQVESRKGVLSEKLALQRRVSSIQAELDNEKKATDRLRAHEGQKGHESEEQEVEIESLRKELSRAQKDIERAEKGVGQVNSEQMNDLKEDLAREKKEREKLERQLQKAESGWEAEKAVLEDKLSQFRSKLKSTKEKLKETELELQEARTAAVSKAPAADVKTKNPRKRPAVSVDPDAAIGTPGDARPAKRTQRASSVIGEKSTFSITPFLNRTASVAPEDQSKDATEEDDPDMPIASIELSSPTARRTASVPPGVVKALAPAPSAKANAKIGPAKERKKAAAKISLAKVAEEPDDEEAVEDTTAKPTQQPQPKEPKQLKSGSLRPKSLTSFASFRAGSLPPQQLQQKKARKLGGAGAKTLFDEDDEDAEVAPGANKNAFGGQRAFGTFGSRALGGLGAWAAKKQKGPLTVAADGFMFSPLKKDRKAAAERAAVEA